MNYSPVFWFQGLFLQPQHLQQQELYIQSLNNVQIENLNYYWGVTNLKFRESSLMEGILEIEKLSARFPDKTWVDYPNNAYLKPRNLKKIASLQETMVYLGLKKIIVGENNVTEDVDEEKTISTRFISPLTPEDVRDIYLTDTPIAKIRFLKYGLNIFFEDELETLNDYYLIPIAKLKKEEKNWTVSSEFIPPLLTISNFSYFSNLLISIKEHILSKLQTLESYKLSKDFSTENFDISYLRYILALLVLNRHIPILDQFTKNINLHPLELYLYLSQLVGELSTFTDRVNALGITVENENLLIDYKHNDLYQSFSKLTLLLEEILDSLVIGAENILKLIREEDLFKTSIPLNLLQDRFNYCLVIETSDRQYIQTFEVSAKIAPSYQLDTLLTRALPGLPFFQRTSPPSGLPKKEHTYFFALEKDAKIWPQIKESGDFCLYWENAPQDAIVSLVISKL